MSEMTKEDVRRIALEVQSERERSSGFRSTMLDAQRTLFKPRVITTQAELTKLSETATDGDECYALADATNGVMLRLRFRAASTSPYRWERVGGPPLFHNLLTAETQTATGAWGDLATVGPTVTVPFAGDYLVSCSSRAINTNAAGQRSHMGVAQGAGTPAQFGVQDIAATNQQATVSHVGHLLTGIAALTELRARYFSVSNGTTFDFRTLTVTTVRLG